MKALLKWELSEIFIFTHLCGASKGFMKAFKALKKIYLIFSLCPGLER